MAGCSGNKAEVKESAAPAKTDTAAATVAPTDASKPDISKKVTLNWYLLGDAHQDSAKVVAELNKLLEKDLNTTLKLNFTTWTDWQTKYNLLLTSGEKVDMVFASSWADYFRLARQGAFLDLTDLLPKYAPITWEKAPKQDWIEATVEGKIFAVPATYPEYTPDGLVYREDWRQELKLPEITDLATIEAYFAGVKAAKPKVTPINGSAWNELFTLFKAVQGYQQIGGDSGVVVAKSYDAPRDIMAYPFTDEFEAWVKKMKEWKDKGYWNTDAIVSKVEAGDKIKVGTGAVYWRNAPGAGGMITGMEKTNPDIKLGYFPFSRIQGYAMPALSINNGMAIPKNAANPERTLMVLDKLRNDPAYYDLLTYGILGTHYDLAADGKTVVTPPKSVTNVKDFKKYDIASWGWRNEPMLREKQAGGWPAFDALLTEFKATTKPNIFAPVLLDYSSVKSQQAAVNQVFEQYGKPLMMGLIPDTEKGLKTFRDKLKAAGVDELVEYVKKEAYIYFDEKGIQ
ncbi:MAG: extracellular solute-binding protein [Gorillibacterium sp.]|nr:extracellular solute-binding protein [Gorillibacterium sp.]